MRLTPSSTGDTRQKPERETPVPTPERPKRESEQKVFEHLSEWVNSPGLRPPK